jgi:hypothetical protein
VKTTAAHLFQPQDVEFARSAAGENRRTIFGALFNQSKDLSKIAGNFPTDSMNG